jgi:hypothetical protein
MLIRGLVFAVLMFVVGVVATWGVATMLEARNVKTDISFQDPALASAHRGGSSMF